MLEKHLPELWRRGARGRARDMYEIGEQLAARGDRRRRAQFFRRAVVGEDASLLRRGRRLGARAAPRAWAERGRDAERPAPRRRRRPEPTGDG